MEYFVHQFSSITLSLCDVYYMLWRFVNNYSPWFVILILFGVSHLVGGQSCGFSSLTKYLVCLNNWLILLNLVHVGFIGAAYYSDFCYLFPMVYVLASEMNKFQVFMMFDHVVISVSFIWRYQSFTRKLKLVWYAQLVLILKLFSLVFKLII